MNEKKNKILAESLENLLQLQIIDKELDEANYYSEKIPQTIKLKRENLSSKEKEIEDLNNKLEELRKKRRDLEWEHEDCDRKLKRAQDLLMKVKSNKEYIALQTEIAISKDRLSDVQENEIKLMMEIEDIENAINKLDSEFKELSKKTEEEIASLEKDLEYWMNLQTNIGEKKKQLTAKISPEYLKEYNRIRKKHLKNAIVTVTNNACGGCFGTIPAKKIQELFECNSLITCQMCGRILVLKD